MFLSTYFILIKRAFLARMIKIILKTLNISLMPFNLRSFKEVYSIPDTKNFIGTYGVTT